MPKKTYAIHELDCANCAAKMEAKFNAHPKVESAVITFATRQLQLTAEDPDALIPELEALARTVEHGVTITEKEGHHEHHGHCEHGHHHDLLRPRQAPRAVRLFRRQAQEKAGKPPQKEIKNIE